MTALSQPAKWERLFWPVLVSLLFLAGWHYAVILTHSKIFPSPLDVGTGTAELFHKGLLWSYMGDSLRRVGIAYGLAALLGIPLGLTLGWYPAAGQVVNP